MEWLPRSTDAGLTQMVSLTLDVRNVGHHWPAALQDLQNTGRTVVYLPHEEGTDRTSARQAVRQVLMALLGQHLGCSPGEIQLQTVAGQPPRVTAQGRRVYASFSHEAQASVIGVHVHGPIGVDILAPRTEPGWEQECLYLARDYLPPTVATQLQALHGEHRCHAFEDAWARHEASLKCVGLALDEWQSMPTSALEGLRVTSTRTEHRAVVACALAGAGLRQR